MRYPPCLHCGTKSELTNGEEVCPHIKRLWSKPIWICRNCKAYCGCHPNTKNALGFPANKETRSARMKLHNVRLDPLWKRSIHNNRKPRFKRGDVYAFLQDEMGLKPEQTHTGMFTIEQCREAWVALGKLWERQSA